MQPVQPVRTKEKRESRVYVLLGPTAVGKTAASLLLAEHLGTEIISADSMQVYRGLDIATAKPSPEELARVAHHLIDVADPAESFSAGRYRARAEEIIKSLHDRDKIPLVVGGTGLYVAALTRGLFEGPEADEALRRELSALPPEELRRRLEAADPEAAAAIEPADVRRAVRALEVFTLTGETITALRARQTVPLPYAFSKVALTRDREELYAMIDRRVDAMLEEGLLEEARRVLEGGACETALQAIGYKELRDHIEGRAALAEALETLKRNTRRYAKRQMTWLRREPGLRWADVTGVFDPVEIERRAFAALQGD